MFLFAAAVTSLSTATQREIKNAKLGEPLTLKCTYNCSNGFTRGFWEYEDVSACRKCEWRSEHSKSGEMCSASLYTPHVMLQQTRYNYSCVSEENDRPGLPRKTELLVTLKVWGKSYVLSFTVMIKSFLCIKLTHFVIVLSIDESYKPVAPPKEQGEFDIMNQMLFGKHVSADFFVILLV